MSNTKTDIRAALINKAPDAESKEISLFGFKVVLRQPSFADIMRAKSTEDAALRAAEMVVKYAYTVPEADGDVSEKIFTDKDLDSILLWPFGDDLMTLQTTIAELTGIDIAGEEEEIATDPLSESS